MRNTEASPQEHHSPMITITESLRRNNEPQGNVLQFLPVTPLCSNSAGTSSVRFYPLYVYCGYLRISCKIRILHCIY